MIHAAHIVQQLNIKSEKVTAVIDLLDAGNTIPFIARYRKEKTGGLDETQLRQIEAALSKMRTVDDRRETIRNSIEEQDKLTPELNQQLLAAASLTELEDLYRPYKPKRNTRADKAREQGLQGLADLILAQPVTNQSAKDLASEFINPKAPTVAHALMGARDIVAQTISDDATVRGRVRGRALKNGILRSRKIKKAADPKQVYKLYYDFSLPVKRLRPHQTLAINRGESEKILRVALEIADTDWLLPLRSVHKPNLKSPLADQMQQAIDDAAQRLLLPAIERDVRRHLTEKAERHAITLFSQNLTGLLNQPPLADHVVLGIDPGFRTGCKVAVVDPTGKPVDTGAIYPHPPQKRWDEALKQLAIFINRHHVTLIAIGNGTASRKTEQLAAELTRKLDDVYYLIVNEAGASVYSASPLAGQELPDMDVTLRGAVSIARRVQDPLAELVKIEPKSIGVGLYQHDVNQKELGEALNKVVESVVNQVGVDLNTASPALLTYVSGIGPKLAEKIVAYRDENGRFRNRRQLLDVRGLGSKSFEQAAGFLRIRDGDNPLDASAIHPESYAVATAVLQKAGLTVNSPREEREAALTTLQETTTPAGLAAELDTGVPTLRDIFEQLRRPGRDPRQDLEPPLLRTDVLGMDDLQSGMQLNGTVRNVVDFGAFIDIGVKQDGLLHRSQIPRRRQLGVGDIIPVKILEVDKKRDRISLGWP